MDRLGEFSVGCINSARYPPMRISRVFIPSAPAPLVAPRNIFAPAVTQLLMLRCPAARVQTGAFCQERGCSLRAGEESSPAPSEQNAKHEHNRKPHLNRMPRNRSATHQSNHQAGKIPGSTPGMENRFITGMPHTRHHATL